MAQQNWMTKVVYLPALVLACFIVGWMVPTFYDWSGANQSYSTPEFDQMFWSLIVFGCLAWFVVPWLPMKDAPVETVSLKETMTGVKSKRFQFNLYPLLMAMMGAAIFFALISHQSVVLCILIWVVAFVAAVRMIVKHLRWRWQFSALLACMYFPFAWVISAKFFKDLNAELLMGAMGLPSFLPALFLGRMFDTHVKEIVWLWGVLMVVELAIGFWLIRKSPKGTIAYFVLVMLISIYGSMFLNMGTRI